MASTKSYETKMLGKAVDATAPDGTAVRLLPSLAGGAWRISNCPQARYHTRSRTERSRKSGSWSRAGAASGAFRTGLN